MVTIGIVLCLAVAVVVGLCWRVGGITAYLTFVAATLALWGAAYGLRQSYATILLILLGLIGSVVFGLAGVLAWWRARSVADGTAWLWLLGSSLSVAPPLVLAGLWAIQ